MLKHFILISVLLVMLTNPCNGMQTLDTMSNEAFNTLRSEILSLRQKSPILAIKQVSDILDEPNNHFTLRQRLRLTYAKALFQIVSNLPDDAHDTLMVCKALSNQLGEPMLEYYYYSYSGRLFNQLEIYDLALENYEQGYEIAISINNESSIKQSANNIGHVLLQLNRLEQANHYFTKVYQYGLEKNKPSYLATGLNNLGEILLARNQIDKAYTLFSQSLSIRKEHNYELNSSWSHANLAKIFRLRKQYPQAIHHIKTAITIREKYGNVIETLSAKLALAEIYQDQNQYHDSIELLLSVSNKAIEYNNYHSYYQAQSLLKTAYKAIKDYDDALQAAEAELISQKKLLQRKAGFNLQHIMATTALKTKELELANLTKEKEIAVEKQQYSQRQTLTLLIVSLVIIGSITIFIINIRRKNRTLSSTLAKLAATQQQLIESEKVSALTTLVSGMAHQLNTPLGVIVTAHSIQQEKLHHLEQLLNNKTLSMTDMKNFVKQSKEATTLAQNNSQKADEMIRQFKLISAELEGSNLAIFEVKSFITARKKMLFSDVGCDIKIHIDGDKSSIINYSEVLFKVLKQLVTNSIDHKNKALAEMIIHITIKHDKNSNGVIIEYTDNGPGIDEQFITKIFDPFFTTKSMQSGLGLGLNIAYNSVMHLMKGRLICLPSTKGAKFIIELPYNIDNNEY